MQGHRRLTHNRAVDLALRTAAAHVEDPGAQQVRVGAVGRSVAVHVASAEEEQQEGGERRAGPGTHAGKALRRSEEGTRATALKAGTEATAAVL